MPRLRRRCAALPAAGVKAALVVGAGLSAADCIVHLLARGVAVTHAYRGSWEATKVRPLLITP